MLRSEQPECLKKLADLLSEILDVPFAYRLESDLADIHGWEVDAGAILLIFEEIEREVRARVKNTQL